VLLDLGEYDSLDVQLESENTWNTRRRLCVNVFENVHYLNSLANITSCSNRSIKKACGMFWGVRNDNMVLV
jgi:hypothetical protein